MAVTQSSPTASVAVTTSILAFAPLVRANNNSALVHALPHSAQGPAAASSITSFRLLLFVLCASPAYSAIVNFSVFVRGAGRQLWWRRSATTQFQSAAASRCFNKGLLFAAKGAAGTPAASGLRPKAKRYK